MLGALVLFFSCTNDDNELGEKLDPSDLDFTVVQDYSIDQGGNTVILTNNTPRTIPVWDYGTGKSNKAIDTVRFAFAGEYVIKFSAVTAGGVVEAEPVTITVSENNFDYVTNPLWVNISGGVGNSKRWYLDLDANGLSRYFAGPLYFYGTNNGWLEGGGPSADGSQQSGCYGDDCWNWNPDWPSNTWIMDAANYGYMEFSLDGGPFVTVNHLTIPTLGSQSGTYYLDVNAHTLSMFDAGMIHNPGYDSCSSNWGDITIFSLTEETMQLGVIREQIGSCASEGPAMIVYNFISQEYLDNWTPPDPVEPECDAGFEPTFAPGELLNMLTGGAGSGRFWKLDGDGNPVDWVINCMGWTSNSSSSYNWGWSDEWAAIADNSWIRFDQWGGLNYTRSEDGVETTGTFSINEATNEITLTDNTLIQNPNSWMNPTTNIITVVKGFNDSYEDDGIWFGTSYNAGSNEWLVFHYELGGSDGSGTGPGSGGDGTEITFDNSLFVFGDLESNGNLRLELYNDFGATAGNPPLDTSQLVFAEKIEVTFTLSGITLNGGAAGSYDAAMQYADADWSIQYWGDGTGVGDTTVTGDGTYTVSFEPDSEAQGAIVFVVDILGMATDITDLTAVTATIDSVVIFE